MKFKFYLLGVLSTFLIIAVAVSGYLIGNKNIFSANSKVADNKDYNSILEPSPSRQKELSVENFSGDFVQETIILSVINNNYQDLIPYMTDVVNFRIEASECCNPMSKDEAVEQLKYLNSAKGEWDFSEESSIASDLASTLPQYYSDAILGISNDEYVVAFQLNNLNKIENISMSATYKIIIQ